MSEKLFSENEVAVAIFIILQPLFLLLIILWVTNFYVSYANIHTCRHKCFSASISIVFFNAMHTTCVYFVCIHAKF